jgi:hypothetical protein
MEAHELPGAGENMPNPHRYPPLKPLHPATSLSPAKLRQIERVSTEELKLSLLPGQRDCLKTRPDGTMLDGHHRIYALRERGVNVDELPREINPKRDL